MKRLIALLLALIMVLSMAACGSEKDNSGDEPTTAPAAGETPDEADTTNKNTGSSSESTGSNSESTDPTEETEPYVPELGEGVYSKTTYTTNEEDLLKHCNDVVATVGDEQMTMSQLQAYYWMYVYSFLSDYGYYLSLFGLDTSVPLDQQACPEADGTWQQYFLSEALNSWHANQSLALTGKAQQVPLPDDVVTNLNNLASEMEAAAEEGNYDSVDKMLQENIGPGVTLSGYKAYLEDYYGGYSFYNHSYTNLTVTDAEIETYFKENEEELKDSEITKDSGNAVDVRHILISPEGGTTSEDGTTTYSDAEWKECEEKAQEILDQWLAGEKTEESFADLANKHSTDPGSNTNGGLYQGVISGDMVEEFDEWCFDESRKVGDYGLVKTTYGYHIMFFSASEERWIAECRARIKNDKINEIITNAGKEYPITVDYEKIMLGHLDLNAAS